MDGWMDDVFCKGVNTEQPYIRLGRARMGAKEVPADGKTPSSNLSRYLCSDSVSVDGEALLRPRQGHPCAGATRPWCGEG